MNTGKALLGVLAGIAAGAVLGVLLAPSKGAHTRKSISKKGEDLADALNEKIDAKFDELMGVVNRKIKKSKTQEESQASREMAD